MKTKIIVRTMYRKLPVWVLAPVLIGSVSVLFTAGCPMAPTVPAVTVSPTELLLGVGETGQLSASSTDILDGFTWSSDDESIATVDAEGLVTGWAEGTTAVSAVGTNSLATGSATVSVGPASALTMGEELLKFVTEEDPYDQWAQFADAPGIIDSAPPHGPKARVFINDVVGSAIDNFTGSLPDGSIIVKESFDENMMESGDSLTIMWKVDGFNPSDNDWFWSMNSFDGEVLAEGKIGSCIGCHGGFRRDNDFVFLHTF